MNKRIIFVLVLLATSAWGQYVRTAFTPNAAGGPAVGIAYVGQCSGTTSCTPPAHAVGDLFVLAVGRDLSTTAPTTTGWTGIGTAQTINGTSTADSYFRLFCKVATTTSETTGTITSANNIALHVYRNTAATSTATCNTDGFGTPVTNTTAINTTSTTVTYGSVTNRDAASWDLAFAYTPAATAGTGTAPTGMTNRSLSGSTKLAGHDTNAAVSSFTGSNVTVTTAGRVMTAAAEIKGPTAATPTLNPSSGTPPQTVTLASATTGAGSYIHYTTTGVDPTSGDTTGTSVSVSADPTTVKAKVISMPGWTDSAVGSGTYTSGGGGGTVTFDAVGPAGGTAAYQTAGVAASTPQTFHLTWTHPGGAGTNMAAFVGCNVISDGDVAQYYSITMTYGGTPMTAITNTQVFESAGGTSGWNFSQIFGLIAPSTGSQTVDVTLAASGANASTDTYELECGSLTVTHANQTTAWQNGTHNSSGGGTTATCTVTVTSAANDLGFNIVGLGAPPSGVRSGTLAFSYTTSGVIQGVGQYQSPSAGSIAFSVTQPADVCTSAGVDIVHD